VKRREFVLAAVALTAASKLPAQTPRVARLGVLATGPAPTPEAARATPFNTKLHELGWEEGRTLTIERRYFEATAGAVPAARELAAMKLDAVLAVGAAAMRAAKVEVTVTPVVIWTVGDPRLQGIIKNLARPEGNLTGVAGFSSDLLAKRVALLKETVPSLNRLGLLGNPANPYLAKITQDLQQKVRAQGIDVRVYQVPTPAALAPAIATIAGDRMQAMMEIPDSMINGQHSKIAELAAKHRIPAMWEDGGFAASGGLMAYGPDFDDFSRNCAIYVDKIFRGAKPGDLPVIMPTRFVMVVNLKAAKALGITIPQSVMLRADKVIE
jgi:putative ABC transport system substrate-binding protein